MFLPLAKNITHAENRNSVLNFTLFIFFEMSYNDFKGFGAFAPPLYLRA